MLGRNQIWITVIKLYHLKMINIAKVVINSSRWISVATHLFQMAKNSFLAILAIYYF